jgi:ABC-2 type transport system ATP-binding protein
VTPDGGAARQVLARLGLMPEPGQAEPGQAESAHAESAQPEPGQRAQPEGETIVAELEGGAQPPSVLPEDVVAHLVQAGVRVRGFAVERESLEDRFVALTGEGFDVAQ